MAVDSIKTVVLDRDIYDEKNGARVLIGRKGERVAPEVARKHGVLPIESAGTPVMEAKVVSPAERQSLTVALNKRAF
jgi:hypothetical protein